MLEPTADSVQVMPGQTLYHLTVKKLGKYNKEVLEEIRKLNPGLGDPDYIQAGQKIRIPSPPAGSTSPQGGAKKSRSAVSEAVAQNE